MIKIIPFNESYIKIQTDDFGAEQEISEFFTFEVPGFRFMPAYKKGIFDGKIRIFDLKKKHLPKGLLYVLFDFLRDRKFEASVDPSLNNSNQITQEEIIEYTDSLKLSARGERLTIRDYQYEAVFASTKTKRNILISPTSCLDPDTEIDVELTKEAIEFVEALRRSY